MLSSNSLKSLWTISYISYISVTYIHLNPILVHSNGFSDCRGMREVKKKCLPVYLMNKVDIITTTVQNFTD